MSQLNHSLAFFLPLPSTFSPDEMYEVSLSVCPSVRKGTLLPAAKDPQQYPRDDDPAGGVKPSAGCTWHLCPFIFPQKHLYIYRLSTNIYFSFLV